MKKSVFIVVFVAVLALLLTSALPGYAHERFGFRGDIWIGPGLGPWWGPPYYGPYYPPYVAPPVVIQQQPPVYVQPAPQPAEDNYWYFCTNPEGYYPYVKQCPNGWMKVVPPSPAAQ